MNMHDTLTKWLNETVVEWTLYQFYFKMEGTEWPEDRYELCFEPCLNGFDVAVYDKDLNLLHPKQCTNVNLGREDIRTVGAAAIRIAEPMVAAIKKSMI